MRLPSISEILSFGEKLGLDKWDWITPLITSATFIISLISLLVACRTLISQRKTEKNTAPIINFEIQLSLLQEYVNSFYKSLYCLFALNFALVKTNFSTRPSHQFWFRFRNPNDYLFEKVFYDDSTKFKSFKCLIGECLVYKKGIERLEVLLEENASVEEIKKEFSLLYGCVGNITRSYMNSQVDSFKLKMPVIIDNHPLKNMFSKGSVKWLKGEDNIIDSVIKELQERTLFDTDKEKLIYQTLKDSLYTVSYNICYYTITTALRLNKSKVPLKRIDKFISLAMYQLSSSFINEIINRMDYNIEYKGGTLGSFIFQDKQESEDNKKIMTLGDPFSIFTNYTLLDKTQKLEPKHDLH